jgi:arabinogalactan endo-1,4-beta-galactosidase
MAWLFLLLFSQARALNAAEYAVGADLSFLKQAEDKGKVFRDGGVAKPGLEIFKDHGYNWIRLRLFHTPTDLPNNLDYTIALAKSVFVFCSITTTLIPGPTRANNLYRKPGRG